MSEKKEPIIKQIKLVTDEIIIAEIIGRGSSDGLKIRLPLLVAVNRYQQSGAYYIGDWIPMCKDEEMPIYFKDIMTVVNPEDHLRDMWIEMTSIKPVTNETDMNLH